MLVTTSLAATRTEGKKEKQGEKYEMRMYLRIEHLFSKERILNLVFKERSQERSLKKVPKERSSKKQKRSFNYFF